MKIRRLACRSSIAAAILSLATALPSHAQWTVFDPVQSAHAIEQIYKRAQDAVTWQQQLATDIQWMLLRSGHRSLPLFRLPH